jgi:hypothetical protein
MTDTRTEIQKALHRFRRWIRQYVLLEGIAASIALACILFWLTFALDVLHFQFRSLELPGWFRLLCTVGMAVLVVGTTLSWILARFFRHLRPADLALALERRFPELNDRLITSVELGDHAATPLQRSMLARTANEAAEQISRLHLQETFDRTPLKRVLLAAGVLVSSVLVFGLANAQGMERWYRAYILGSEDYWEPFRRQDLEVHVVAQPGDRIRKFDEFQVYKHPRGADLQLVALAREGTAAPEQVNIQSLTFASAGTRRVRVTMSRVGELEFRHTASRVLDDQHLWFRGGDYINRSPFRVQVVPPPVVERIRLRCQYPEYTGLQGQEDRLVPVVGTQAALPMETRFDLMVDVNKPLVRVHLHGSHLQLSLGFEQQGTELAPLPPQLRIIDPETRESRTVEVNVAPADLFDPQRRQFHIPFVVSASAEEQLAELDGLADLPLPLPPDETLQIYLEDEDQIYSPEPAMVTINGIVDQPPVVDIRRTGIGTVVTRMANIPIEGKLTDDYGVEDAWFGYRIDHDPEVERRPLEHRPAGQREFVLGSQSDAKAEFFNLIPLRLQEQQTLTLGVYAQDGDNLNGPHVSHGELFTFKIVSKEELLSRLYDREVNLRMRFEQIRSEVEELRTRVVNARELAELFDGDEGGTPEQSADLSSFVERGLHQLRKNHTESRSIEVSFRDLRSEMVNNRVDTQEMLTRIDTGVIAPLATLNEELFLEADRKFGVIRLQVERRSNVSAAVRETVPAVNDLLDQMDRILAEMRDRGTYNELIQQLQQIIEQEKKLLEKTEEKRIQENFFFPLNDSTK